MPPRPSPAADGPRDTDDCDVESGCTAGPGPVGVSRTAPVVWDATTTTCGGGNGTQKDHHPLKRSTGGGTANKQQKEISKALSKSFHKYDDKLLHRAIADAGRWAFGTVFVELWALNEEQTLLTHPKAGWWVDPVFHRGCGDGCQICRLSNVSRDDYIPPVPVVPGEGLPGVLWAETVNAFGMQMGNNNNNNNNNKCFGGGGGGPQQGSSPLTRRTVLSLPDAIFSEAVAIIATAQQQKKKVAWREVQAIASDPDQAWNPRLQLLASLGLGWVAAVAFNLHGRSGIVVYMARDGVDLTRLQSESNEAYLIAASDLAGAAFALRGPRRKMVDERRAELAAVLRRVRDRILALVRVGVDLEALVEKNAARKEEMAQQRPTLESQFSEGLKSFQERLFTMLRKSLGGGVQPPPVFTWMQSLFAFVGVFITLLMVTRLNVHVSKVYGLENSIVLGPFGALATLLFGLTAAPASQPRNAILGQAISLTIGICFGYADAMTIWLRQSLATALAVAVMVKLGLTHPPAAASALIFASGQFRWGSMLFLLIGYVIALSTATLLNNWSNKRQYPSYWGIPQIDAYVGMMKANEAKKVA